MKIKIIFLTFLFGFNYLNFYSQNTFNNAQGNGDWATPGNWSIGVVPQAGIGAGLGNRNNAVIGSDDLLSDNGSYGCNRLEISAGITMEIEANFTITTDLILTGELEISGAVTVAIGANVSGDGKLTVENGKVTIAGNATFTDLDAGTGTIEYNLGGAQNIANVTYHHLTFSTSGTKTALSAITTTGDVLISGNTEFDLDVDNTFKLVVGGDLTINSNCTFTVSPNDFAVSNTHHTIAGTFKNSGTFNPTVDGVVQCNNFNNARENGFVCNRNQFYLFVTNECRWEESCDISKGKIHVSGNWVVETGKTYQQTSGIVKFKGSASQSITGTNNFDKVVVETTSNSVDVTNTGALTLTDELEIKKGIFKTGAATLQEVGIDATGTLFLTGNITVSNDWTNAGIFTSGTNTVTFNGNSNSDITTGGNSDAQDFHDVIINKDANSDVVTVKTNLIQVDATTTITRGKLVPLTASDFDIMIIANGILSPPASATITVSGNFTNAGTFTHGNGKVTFDGPAAADQEITSGTSPFYNLEVSSAARDVFLADAFVLADGGGANALTIGADGIFSLRGQSFRQNGATITNNGTFEMYADNDVLALNIAAGLTRIEGNTGILTTELDGVLNIEFNSAFNGGNKVYSLQEDLAYIAAGGSLTIEANTTLDVTGGNHAITVPKDWTNKGIFISQSGTVTFNGAAESIITTGGTTDDVHDFHDLVINKNAEATEVNVATNAIQVDATTTITQGTFLPLTASDFNNITITDPKGIFTAPVLITVSGNIDNSAGSATTFLNGSGTVNLIGGVVQTLKMKEAPFNNLTVNNGTSGVTVLDSKTIVNAILTFASNSDITAATEANSIEFGVSGTYTGATDDKHIVGYCSKKFTNVETEFFFPVGNGTFLRPIKFSEVTGTATYNVKYLHERGAPGGGPTGDLHHISGYYAQQTPSNPNTGYHFQIKRTVGNNNAKLYLEWTNADIWGTGGAGAGGLSSLTFAKYNGTNWVEVASTLGGLQQSISGNLITTNVININNNIRRLFTLGSTDAGLFLPIDLLSFTGECVNNQTNIEFVVASQVNNEYFTIKRSTNNLEWEEVGFINGGGTNNEEITYTWTDYSPKSGVNYYKLFQTDIDGISKSFSPIAINCENKVDDYHIYPNPTNDRVSVEFDLEYYQGDDIQVVLKDFKGVVVKSNPIELKRGYNYFELDLSKLQNGFYVLSYSGTKNHIPSKRIVKL